MIWYAAHVIMAPLVQGKEDCTINLYENVFLISAETDAAAWKRAEVLGREGEVSDDGLTVDGETARWTFLGVRKIISISNYGNLPQDTHPPVDGTELTYSTQRLESLAKARAFARGEVVELVALDWDIT